MAAVRSYYPALCLAGLASPALNACERSSVWGGPSSSSAVRTSNYATLCEAARVTIPVHAGKVLGLGLTQAILKHAGVDVDELRRVL